MFFKRPWVNGKIIETIKNDPDDAAGIDMFVPADQRLVNLLCIEPDRRGLLVQIKSSSKKEEYFTGSHKQKIFNLAKGENIFVLNGQEENKIQMATLVGQMIIVAGLTDTVSEEVFLGFLAEDLMDKEAVLAYLENREYLLREKWFGDWLSGRISLWKY